MDAKGSPLDLSESQLDLDESPLDPSKSQLDLSESPLGLSKSPLDAGEGQHWPSNFWLRVHVPANTFLLKLDCDK